MRHSLFKHGHTDNTASRGSRTGSPRSHWTTSIRGGLSVWVTIIMSLCLGNVPALAAPSVPAPDFQLQTFDGELYSKTSLQGRPALLMFWAPWCRYCQIELPVLAKFYQESKPSHLQVLTIAFADSRANVEEYVTSNPDTFVFPTAFDQGNEVAQAFGVNATPTFVVMDAQGNMILAHQGAGLHRNPRYQEFLRSMN